MKDNDAEYEALHQVSVCLGKKDLSNPESEQAELALELRDDFLKKHRERPDLVAIDFIFTQCFRQQVSGSSTWWRRNACIFGALGRLRRHFRGHVPCIRYKVS